MERFGRYLLLERVACGGMAEVFRAATLGSPEFSNSVAIKMILPELAEDPASAAMLVEEAREVVSGFRSRLDGRVETPGPLTGLEHVPDRDTGSLNRSHARSVRNCGIEAK